MQAGTTVVRYMYLRTIFYPKLTKHEGGKNCDLLIGWSFRSPAASALPLLAFPIQLHTWTIKFLFCSKWYHGGRVIGAISSTMPFGKKEHLGVSRGDFDDHIQIKIQKMVAENMEPHEQEVFTIDAHKQVFS